MASNVPGAPTSVSKMSSKCADGSREHVSGITLRIGEIVGSTTIEPTIVPSGKASFSRSKHQI